MSPTNLSSTTIGRWLLSDNCCADRSAVGSISAGIPCQALEATGASAQHRWPSPQQLLVLAEDSVPTRTPMWPSCAAAVKDGPILGPPEVLVHRPDRDQSVRRENRAASLSGARILTVCPLVV